MNKNLEDIINHCEFEQLHLSGAIQSFGAIIRVDTNNETITHASQNLSNYASVNPQDIIGKNFNTLEWFNIKYLLELPLELGKSIYISNIASGLTEQVDAILIRGESCVLIELEKYDTNSERMTNQHQIQSSPDDKNELIKYNESLLNAFREITNFDRVMIYHFLDDWSGEVIAEATSEGIGSYLGLHFPASDIPLIARSLYLKNPSRFIQNVKAEAIPILGIDESIPDLTYSELRSVSPVHLEYLSNMGVHTSFSVPIRFLGNLWGLVTCHHLSVKMLSRDQRQSCIRLTNTYALRVSHFLSGQRLQVLDSVDRRIEKIVEALSERDDLVDGIKNSGNLFTEALNASSFTMVTNEDIIILGHTMDIDSISVIDNWFLKYESLTFITDNLSSIFPSSLKTLSMASGMIAIKVRSLKTNWVRLYWFRPEVIQEVKWAGNPNKSMNEDNGSNRLSPRRSFEKWIEIKKGFSRPWTSVEKMTATKFRSTLMHWL
jgi:two-component system, chemotaxis family, sensor kinase Cph1